MHNLLQMNLKPQKGKFFKFIYKILNNSLQILYSRNVRVVNIPEDEQQNLFSDPRDKDMNMVSRLERLI